MDGGFLPTVGHGRSGFDRRGNLGLAGGAVIFFFVVFRFAGWVRFVGHDYRTGVNGRCSATIVFT